MTLTGRKQSNGATPFQLGAAIGDDRGGAGPLRVLVDWLVDTGAEVPVVQARVGDRFNYRLTGATASPTTGSVGIAMVAGIDVEIAVGSGPPVAVAGDVGVKSDNRGNNLVGMSTLKTVGAAVCWNPSLSEGELRSNAVRAERIYVTLTGYIAERYAVITVHNDFRSDLLSTLVEVSESSGGVRVAVECGDVQCTIHSGESEEYQLMFLETDLPRWIHAAVSWQESPDPLSPRNRNVSYVDVASDNWFLGDQTRR